MLPQSNRRQRSPAEPGPDGKVDEGVLMESVEFSAPKRSRLGRPPTAAAFRTGTRTGESCEGSRTTHPQLRASNPLTASYAAAGVRTDSGMLLSAHEDQRGGSDDLEIEPEAGVPYVVQIVLNLAGRRLQ